MAPCPRQGVFLISVRAPFIYASGPAGRTPTGVAGAWRLPVSASNLPPDAHSFGGKRSVRALIAAARSGSFGEGGLGDGESLLSSPLLLSAGVFLCPRTALPGRSVTGKLTGRPYGEAPLGRSRLLS